MPPSSGSIKPNKRLSKNKPHLEFFNSFWNHDRLGSSSLWLLQKRNTGSQQSWLNMRGKCKKKKMWDVRKEESVKTVIRWFLWILPKQSDRPWVRGVTDHEDRCRIRIDCFFLFLWQSIPIRPEGNARRSPTYLYISPNFDFVCQEGWGSRGGSGLGGEYGEWPVIHISLILDFFQLICSS